MNISKLNQIQQMFEKSASVLGEHRLMTKTELANGYCDADEALYIAEAQNNIKEKDLQENLRSAYHSALMLRYWYKIFEWINTSASLNLEPEEFVDWLVDSLYVAFYYRVWRWEHEAVVKNGKFISWKTDSNGNLIPNKYYYLKDPNSPDKIINRCCGSMRGRMYQYYNKYKRKSCVQTYSIENMIEDSGDSALDYLGCVSDMGTSSGVNSIIESFIHRNELLEALIVDEIVNNDPFKLTKTEEGKVSKFNPRLLVKSLNNIDKASIRRFISQYNVSKDKGESLFDMLKKTPSSKLYKCIKKTLIEIKQTPELINCLS